MPRPTALHASDGFECVVKVDADEEFAPLLVGQRLQPELPADDQLRLFAKELHRLGNHVASVPGGIPAANCCIS